MEVVHFCFRFCFPENLKTASASASALMLPGDYRVGQKVGFFKKKPSPAGFFGFFWVLLGFIGFFGVYWVSLGLFVLITGFWGFVQACE